MNSRHDCSDFKRESIELWNFTNATHVIALTQFGQSTITTIPELLNQVSLYYSSLCNHSTTLALQWPKMAPSRAPLMELSVQFRNHRSMSARQQTYGKHRRPAGAQDPIWESTGDEETAVTKSNKPYNRSSLLDDDQLASSFEKLVVASHNTIPESKSTELKSQDSPGLLEARLTTSDSQGTPTFTKNCVGELESSNVPSLAKPVLGKLDSQNHDAADTSHTPPTSSDHLAPTSRVTRRTKETSPLLPELDVTALLRESYAHTNNTKSFPQIIPFNDFAAKLNKQFTIKKLSDGSFGDVYKLVAHSSTKSSSKDRLEQLGGGVLKVMPLAGNTGFGSRKFSRVDNVVSEVKVLRRLDALHGFTRFRDVHVVQGRYPDSFLDAYNVFDEEVRECGAPNPVKFTERQFYAVIEMDDAGEDLEECLLGPNIFQIHDIFWAATIILAHGESQVEFETRDMHAGNICLRPFTHNGTMDISDHQLSSWSKNQVRHLGLTETRVTLIDYTLSRASMEDGSVAFYDLSKARTMLMPANDKPLTLQQRAYAQTYELVRAASAKSKKKEDWSLFVPRTNVAWLSYLLTSLLEIRDPDYPEASNEACIQAQDTMLGKLQCVVRALRLATSGGDAGAGSAEALLALALRSQWLNRSEIEWYSQRLESEL